MSSTPPTIWNRFLTALTALVVLGGSGAGCWVAAQSIADFIEDKSREEVGIALQNEGMDWVSVDIDGLQVLLTGAAPGESDRFRAVSTAAKAVDARRIIDDMTIEQPAASLPPEFKIELLRNDSGISLIGLVPASTDRSAVVDMLKRGTAALPVTDLLEAADYPVPENWDAALEYGLQVAQMAQSAKVSIQPGQVNVMAITNSSAEKARLQSELTRRKPADVTLSTSISAPRPVIAPFTLRFVIDDQGARLEACTADTDQSREAIIQAAQRAGAAGTPDCDVGLGAPSPEWERAAVAGIDAVDTAEQGSVTLSDADVALVLPATLSALAFDEITAQLESALPSAFSLKSVHEQTERADEGPTEFTAAIGANGVLNMQGRITDEQMRDVVDSIARARFGTVNADLQADSSVPSGWTVRVIGGLEAMAQLSTGSLTVTPDLLQITGTSGDPQAIDKTTAALAERLGPGVTYQLNIKYDRMLDPSLDLPTGQDCIDALNRIMSESAIGFEPSRSIIAGNPDPTLGALAEQMTECRDYQIEVSGHTDAQGSDGFNAELSRTRAQAILAAMTETGIDTTNMTARGYGESQPIATNDTEEGREANRRIEFRLMSETPARIDPLPEPDVVTGITAQAGSPVAPVDVADPKAPAITVASVREGTIAMPGDARLPGLSLTEPVMPTVPPSVVGASEMVTNDRPTEDLTSRMPINAPTAETPRPSPRPEDEAGDLTDDSPTETGSPQE